MGKKIGLKQIYQKSYNEVPGLSPELKGTLGEIEDAFDMICWGDSAQGKTSFNLEVMAQLVMALQCKAVYVSWEEGHGKSLRDALVRHNLMERIGNRLEIMDGGSFAHIQTIMRRRKSAKIWVFDSIQASEWTTSQYMELKKEFVMSRKKKIFMVISWEDAKKPKGSTARDIKFYANIKIRVERFIAFPTGRYGGNKNFIIWKERAMKVWPTKLFNKHKGQ